MRPDWRPMPPALVPVAGASAMIEPLAARTMVPARPTAAGTSQIRCLSLRA